MAVVRTSGARPAAGPKVTGAPDGLLAKVMTTVCGTTVRVTDEVRPPESRAVSVIR